jgi:hypothetical protein
MFPVYSGGQSEFARTARNRADASETANAAHPLQTPPMLFISKMNSETSLDAIAALQVFDFARRKTTDDSWSVNQGRKP